MKILLCSERLIFRFGVDRTLIILGRKLKKLGCEIFVMANKIEKEVVSGFASKIINVPQPSDYITFDNYVLDWLKKNWRFYFDRKNKPDIVYIAGWPFFSSIKFFKEEGIKVIFNDFGAVPLDGLEGYALEVQKILRSLREKNVRFSDFLIAISKFILNSQSLKIYPQIHNARVIHLGVDYILDDCIWEKSISSYEDKLIDILKEKKKKGYNLIFNLGRFEKNNYKNSESSFTLLKEILSNNRKVLLLLLAQETDIEIPNELKSNVLCLGYLNDSEMAEVMRLSDLGVSMSLWEGFNLPLAEMQFLGKPCLAFNKGAHSEVIIDQWYLCNDMDDMLFKAIDILNNKKSIDINRLVEYRNYFNWDRVIAEYFKTFQSLMPNEKKLRIFIDVSNSSIDPANSGVIRVTRRLSRILQDYLDPIFIKWDSRKKSYVFLNEKEFEILGNFGGPIETNFHPMSPENDRVLLQDWNEFYNKKNDWLFTPEIIYENEGQHIRNFARKNNIKLVSIFYDAIPVLRPDLVKDEKIKNNHVHYMKGLANYDLIFAISSFSKKCLEDFWKANNIKGCSIETNLLPVAFKDYSYQKFENRIISEKNIISDKDKKIKILCVSTLEPRKNHKRIIEACLLFKKRNPNVEWELILVGNRYAGAPEIPEYIKYISSIHPEIKWLGIVNDKQLSNLYMSCSFTIYASEIEGYGMPILESLYYNKPCICYNQGVMYELAKEGGCLTVDVLNVEELCSAIEKLSFDRDLYLKLVSECRLRRLKSWHEFAQEFISYLLKYSSVLESILEAKNINQEILLLTKLYNFEILSLIGLIQIVNPSHLILVDIEDEAFLYFASCYAKTVFAVGKNLNNYKKNISLIGKNNISIFDIPSKLSFPFLLNEMDLEGLYPEFILINGKTNQEVLKQNFKVLLNYKPKKNLYVFIYNSFDPHCRKLIINTKWSDSKYIHYLDIDFIPGKVLDDKTITGGFSMIFLKKEKRKEDLVIREDKNLFKIFKKYVYGK